MPVSFPANFVHFPTSITISNSNNLAAARLLLPPLSAKPLQGSLRLSVKCHGGGEPENANKDGHEKDSLESVDKLYKGIKNKHIDPLLDVLAHQRPDIANSIRLPKKPNNFLSYIVKALQNSLIFSVQPTTNAGSMVGIKWKVGWNKPLMESEKGVSIHSHHSYVGKLLIGNLETIINPLLRLGSKTLQKNWNWVPTKQRRVASVCVGLFLLVLSLFFFQFSVR